MPLKYLIDENLRGKLAQPLLARSAAAGFPLDFVTVGEPEAPALGTSDPDLLRWAQREDRVLVSLDRNTLPVHLAAHLASGSTSPGILLIRDTRPWEDVFDFLIVAGAIASPEEFADRCSYFP
jgi:hypothetical protein